MLRYYACALDFSCHGKLNSVPCSTMKDDAYRPQVQFHRYRTPYLVGPYIALNPKPPNHTAGLPC